MWFRYPSRPDQWILKNFTLTIQPCDSIAIVGESGQGKSTLINLIMRFYDPDFGSILVDDIDITEWNINELRMKMGLVMQEPTLFNYTVKENILYGKIKASNEEIVEAALIANANEFIESKELERAFETSATSLATEWENSKKTILEIFEKKEEPKLAEKRYAVYEKSLKKKKQIELTKHQTFAASIGDIDMRTDAEKGDFALHRGYAITSGIKGSKLSGG